MLVRSSIIAAGAGLVLGAGVAADTHTYVGTSTDWNEPTNWDPPQVPGPADDVIVGGALVVHLPPDPTGATIQLGSVRVEDGARLVVESGARLELAGDLSLDSNSDVSFRSSEVSVDRTVLTLAATGMEPAEGLLMNPTTKDQRDVIVETTESGLTYHLGGSVAASAGNTGPGFYANDTADNIQLNGRLQIGLLYGFSPTPGDSFDIMTARVSMSGAFVGLADGDVVASFSTADLVIDYHAGGVRLNAVAPTGPVGTFVGPGTDFDDPANWDIGRVPGPNDEAVIDGFDVVIGPRPGRATALDALRVINRTAVETEPGTELVVYGDLVVDSSSFMRCRSSELSVDRTVLTRASSGMEPAEGFMMNPTSKDQRDIIVEATESGMTYVLGGLVAASPGNTGSGFYANDAADTVELDGRLRIGLLYGFMPNPGDSFDIIAVRSSISGEFANAPDGSVVASFPGVDLVIDYHTGGVRLDAVAGCECEADGVSGVTINDLLAYLSAWFADEPEADRNGDLIIDVIDLLSFLSCWFPASNGATCP